MQSNQTNKKFVIDATQTKFELLEVVQKTLFARLRLYNNKRKEPS